MVEEEQRDRPQPPIIKPVGKDIKKHNYALIGVMILVIGTLASFGLDYLLGLSGGSGLNTGGSQASVIVAKTVLVNASAAADAYAVTNDNSYLGMTGASLADIGASVAWAVGGPEKGKVAVAAVSDKAFTLIYTDHTGAQYRAVKNEGEIVMTDGSGKQI